LFKRITIQEASQFKVVNDKKLKLKAGALVFSIGETLQIERLLV
jgi:hypothetical protein